ncbi:iron chaperone [Agromyces sp. SYSU T00266]|uniref:iron chaperone n=1 Tax=Agromyces zhanjiangensis TaxID=3158562 RepID=UPI003397093B
MTAQTVDEYVASFPDEVADRLRRVRAAIVAEVPPPAEEKMRYGIAAVMLGGRYALHFAGWKHHIGLYPVPTLPEPLESEVAPLRTGKDSVNLPHSAELPVELVGRIAAAIVAMRGASAD